MKRLAITMGDPGGVGPEIIVKCLRDDTVRSACSPVVIADPEVMEEALALLPPADRSTFVTARGDADPRRGRFEMVPVRSASPLAKNEPTAGGGSVSLACVKKAVEMASSREVEGIVTAPISKEAWKMAGAAWPGHTELLAELSGTRDYAMMLVGGPLRVILVTIHVRLKDVPGSVTKEHVLKTIRLAGLAAESLGIPRPSIAVAGLNPHAGEGGIFGDEEVREILPAVEEARRQGIPVTGPLPPDTVFYKAYNGEFQIVVCMYHDQGLIPLKMLAFDSGVNMTVGLPFVRTSPDHGTAYDIAWTGKASASSMREAIMLASRLRT
jgi:4-hydroxythreonine-4-phosphate dehydrogenase